MNKINYEERAKVYTDALETFGANLQLVVALEELSEAQKEICKVMRGGGSLPHLAEEVADATIMLEQVRQLFDINAMVGEVMDAKVLRLRQRVEAAKDRTELRDEFLRLGLQIPRPYSYDEKTESGLLEEG